MALSQPLVSKSAVMAKKAGKPRKIPDKPDTLGWKTSDIDETEPRSWRGRTGIIEIEALEPKFAPYGLFKVGSGSGRGHKVEIRDLVGRTNSCGCAEHRVNGLGTCKHIEGALFALERKLGARAFAAAAVKGSPHVKVFLDRDGPPAPTLAGAPPSDDARGFLAPFLDRARLSSDPETIARRARGRAPSPRCAPPTKCRQSRATGPASNPPASRAAGPPARETETADRDIAFRRGAARQAKSGRSVHSKNATGIRPAGRPSRSRHR